MGSAKESFEKSNDSLGSTMFIIIIIENLENL
jgi:hypothetical protein